MSFGVPCSHCCPVQHTAGAACDNGRLPAELSEMYPAGSSSNTTASECTALTWNTSSTPIFFRCRYSTTTGIPNSAIRNPRMACTFLTLFWKGFENSVSSSSSSPSSTLLSMYATILHCASMQEVLRVRGRSFSCCPIEKTRLVEGVGHESFETPI